MGLRVQHGSNHILLFQLFAQKVTGHTSFKKRILNFIKSLKTIPPGDQWQKNEVITVLCIYDIYVCGKYVHTCTQITHIFIIIYERKISRKLDIRFNLSGNVINHVKIVYTNM